LEVHNELTQNEPEFETHVVFRLRQEDANLAGMVAGALADYHATLYHAASQVCIDGVPFMLMAKSLSHVLSANFPRFSAMIEKNPEVLKNCLSYHHTNP
jgi:hypothetical protein